MKKNFISLFALLLAVSCVSQPAKQEIVELTPESTPKEVLDVFMAGNARFAEGHAESIHREMEYVKELEAGQHPYVAVVACSDSRVPVELLFDEGFGDIFVVRTAGNTILDDLSLGSVDYALNHLGVKVIFIMGHTNCGAITGVVEMGHEHHAVHNDEEVAGLLESIAKTIEQHRGTGCNLTQAVKDNVLNQTALYTEREFVKKQIEEGKLLVVPSIYDLSTGKIEILK